MIVQNNMMAKPLLFHSPRCSIFIAILIILEGYHIKAKMNIYYMNGHKQSKDELTDCGVNIKNTHPYSGTGSALKHDALSKNIFQFFGNSVGIHCCRLFTTRGSAIAEGPRDTFVSRNSATTKYRYRVELFA